jgi:deoxyadenosine/deoxycytidine kinase
MHIAVTGNIGVGKTTLVRKLAEHYKWEALFEAVEGNPFLADFYEDMPRWAFNLQIFFLNSRFEQAQTIRAAHYKTVIQDRTIYEDAHIFAKNLYQSGMMEKRDFECYFALYQTIIKTVAPPDVIIYLKADLAKFTKQIAKRGRDFEQSIDPQYLLNLNELYEGFADNYVDGTLITIDVNDRDFENNPEDFEYIVAQVNDVLGYKPLFL